MITKTYLKFREQGDKGPTNECSVLEGIILNLPIGHKVRLDFPGKEIFMRRGFYEVYSGPFDSLYVVNDKEDIFERSYQLKYVEEVK